MAIKEAVFVLFLTPLLVAMDAKRSGESPHGSKRLYNGIAFINQNFIWFSRLVIFKTVGYPQCTTSQKANNK